jgi:hypothetical protein
MARLAASVQIRADISDVRYWHLADIGLCAAHVRYWHKADVPIEALNVCFRE